MKPIIKRAAIEFNSEKTEGQYVHHPELKTSNHAPVCARKAAHIAVIMLKTISILAIAYILLRQFQAISFCMVSTLLKSAGAGIAIVLIPPCLAALADSLGLSLCVPKSRPYRRTLNVLPVRLGCDALLNSIPAGVIAGEALRPIWLRRVCNIQLDESLAACLMGKINMAAAQMVFLVVIIALIVFIGASQRSPAQLSQNTLLMVVGIFLLTVAAVGFIYSGPRLTQVMALVKRVACSGLKTRVSRVERAAVRVDGIILHAARKNRVAIFASLIAFLSGWIALGMESYVIMRVIGIQASVAQGLLMEGTACVLRVGLFFIPSALGAAEAAYFSLIAGFGVQDPASVALAFAAIKRSREILWVGIGYVTILFSGRH